MLKLTVFTLLLSTSYATKLPIRFNFGSHSPSLKSIKNCEGHEDDVLTVIGGSSPEEICMPGIMAIDSHTLIKEDLPEDLTMFLKLQKLEPFPMTVPCLNGIGSCPYDLCSMLDSDVLCPHFPETQPCACPVKAQELDMKGIEVPVPDMGEVLGTVMEGKYTAKATLYGLSAPDKILGCFDLAFSLKKCS